VTPEGRLSAAIDLLHQVFDQPRRPADANAQPVEVGRAEARCA
jgi:hypothetical protein